MGVIVVVGGYTNAIGINFVPGKEDDLDRCLMLAGFENLDFWGTIFFF
jgi:hypothetical protein